MRKDTTSQKFEKAIKRNPKRYIASYNKNNELMEVHDIDSGILWLKRGGGWIWIV